MIADVPDFTEVTLFERLALDRVLPLLGDECTFSLDLRLPPTNGVEVKSASLYASSSGEAVNDVVLSLLPLFFGAAWKILDLFVELALNLAGEKPKRKNWSINEKVEAAQVGKGFKSLLTADATLWQAVLAAYVETHEHRHCLTHRTAQFSSQSMQLSGVDGDDAPIRPLTKPELDAFIAVAKLVALGVLAGGLDTRSANHLRFELDLLQAHTACPTLGGVPKSKPVILRLQALSLAGLFSVDFDDAQRRADKAHPGAHYDTWINLPDDSGRILFARMEDVPKETVRFSLNALPKYLVLR